MILVLREREKKPEKSDALLLRHSEYIRHKIIDFFTHKYLYDS